MASLFEERTRTGDGGRSYGQSMAGWLDDNSGDPAAKARGHLEAWFGPYPESEKADLKRRLYSADDREYQSAVAELWLHNALTAANLDVQVHPTIEGSGKHPDFLATGGHAFYVEVRALGEPQDMSALDARVSQLGEVLNRSPHPNFMVSIQPLSLDASPPAAVIAKQANAWLDTLDPDEVGATGTPAERVFEVDGMRLKLYAFPMKVEARSRNHSAVGGTMGTVRAVNGIDRIRDRLGKKSGRYGTLAKPYLIAIVSRDLMVQFEDAFEALFGTSFCEFRVDGTGEISSQVKRHPDGFFRPKRNTRVSGLIFVRRLAPWAPEEAQVALYHNPYAQYPLPREALPVRQFLTTSQTPTSVSMEWVDASGRSTEEPDS